MYLQLLDHLQRSPGQLESEAEVDPTRSEDTLVAADPRNLENTGMGCSYKLTQQRQEKHTILASGPQLHALDVHASSPLLPRNRYKL